MVMLDLGMSTIDEAQDTWPSTYKGPLEVWSLHMESLEMRFLLSIKLTWATNCIYGIH